jgi:RimJ/RimL family protein N-acetyltransferase
MFARTERLTLRPPWPEDAPALAEATGHEAVVKMLARAPWPYQLDDAVAWTAASSAPDVPRFLIFAHDHDSPRLVGAIGIDGEGHDLGCWITPSAWNRGYATEAGRAVIAIARDTLRLPHLRASCFSDNPASGRVLGKLGFSETGRAAQPSLARGSVAPAILMTLDLIEAPCRSALIAA